MKSNVTTILSHLDLPKYDVVRDMIRGQWKSRVEVAVERWFEEMKTFDVASTHREPSLGFAAGFLNTPASIDTGAFSYNRRAKSVQAAVIAGEYKIDYDKVQKAADAEWSATKAFYAARVGEKIDVLLQAEADIVCELDLSSCLVGTVIATVALKKLVLATSLKTNYRYGVFAADRKMTVYRQVPTIVESYSGFDLPAREAEIVRETEAAKAARREAIGAMQKEILTLEKQKRLWDDIHHSLDYSAKYEKDQPIHQRHVDAINQRLAKLSLPPMVIGELTAKAAYAKVKELRAALKAAKLKLREVRQPNSMEAVS